VAMIFLSDLQAGTLMASGTEHVSANASTRTTWPCASSTTAI
jgi:hypothetical protein